MKVADGVQICGDCKARRYVDLEDLPQLCYRCLGKKLETEEI